MSTNNFYNVKHGIIILDAEKYMDAYNATVEYEDEKIDYDCEWLYEDMIDSYIFNVEGALENLGYSLIKTDDSNGWNSCYSYEIKDSNGLLHGKITLQSGYYSDVQVIFETCKQLIEDEYFDGLFFENNQLMNTHDGYYGLEYYRTTYKDEGLSYKYSEVLKAVKKYANYELIHIATASNGEAFYQKK